MLFSLALLSALLQVLRNMSMKHRGHTLDETINVWGRFTFILPFLAGFVWWHGIPPLKPGFWTYVILFGFVQTLATLCLSKALKLSDISIVTALWKVSLFGLVGVAFVTIGETPSPLGLAGIFISVIGVYLLNVHKSRISFWAPLRELVVDRGLRFTIHNDAQVTPTLPLHLMWCAVNRVSVSGAPIGRVQALAPNEALRAHTIDAAWQVFQDHERGSIEPGKRADFAVLSKNPLDDPAGINGHAVPGSNGRACPADPALSSRISIRRSASGDRYSAASRSTSLGIRVAGTPSERSSPSSATAGARTSRSRVRPRCSMSSATS